MGRNLQDAFSISFDGSTKTGVSIKAPSNGYIGYAPHALVKNELFIFGGYGDPKKVIEFAMTIFENNFIQIAKFSGCEWHEQSTKLINNIDAGSAALSVENGEKALLCFPDDSESKKCEVFDGTASVSTYSTFSRHWGGKLGLFKGQPTTVGNDGSSDDSNNVETLSYSGWLTLADFPRFSR